VLPREADAAVHLDERRAHRVQLVGRERLRDGGGAVALGRGGGVTDVSHLARESPTTIGEDGPDVSRRGQRDGDDRVAGSPDHTSSLVPRPSSSISRTYAIDARSVRKRRTVARNRS
jgi:hypothetical protein